MIRQNVIRRVACLEKRGMLLQPVRTWQIMILHPNGEREEGANDKCVGRRGNHIGELDVELLVVVLDPATRVEASVDTIKANDVAGTKDTVKEKTDHSSNTVLSEHIKGIVDLDPEFD